ncbi:MAG: hypothetical protein RIS35_2002 [Pseudomonadota bacterium]
MLRRRWPLLLAALAVLALAVFFLAPRGLTVDVVTAVRGPVTQSVVASGRIATPARITISSQLAARIDRVPVREGDQVRAGQLLVQLRSEEADAALDSARAALAEAQGRARQLRDVQRPVAEQQLVQASAALRLAEQELQRAHDLRARGFVAQARVDEAERSLASARASELAAQAQARANLDGGVEGELVRTRLAQARAALEAAQARRELLALRAPADAVVLTRLAEPGDTAQVGRAVLELAQDGETRIVTTVDEKNLRFLAKGLKASAVADAFPDRRFDAVVTYVAPAIDAQRGTVELRLTVPNPPDFLKTDMTVSVEMVAGRRDSAVLVPADVVRAGESGTPWVLVARDGRAVRVPVTLGLRGVGVAEITGGLEAGETVIVPAAPAVPGDRVRARARDRGSKVPGAQQAPGLRN